MVRLAASRQRFCGALLDEWLRGSPFGPNVREAQLVRALSCDDNQIHPRWHEPRREPEAFTAEPFDAISANRPPDLPAHDDPEARNPRLGRWLLGPEGSGRRTARLRGYEQGEMGRCDAPTKALGQGELGMPT